MYPADFVVSPLLCILTPDVLMTPSIIQIILLLQNYSLAYFLKLNLLVLLLWLKETITIMDNH